MTKRLTSSAIACSAALVAASAPISASAAPGGMLDTLKLGTYVCSLPGDASGPARIVVEDEQFVIATASTYSTDSGWGTYLLTGNKVKFSRGPMKDGQYLRESNYTLRKLTSDGKKTELRCTRRGSPA